MEELQIRFQHEVITIKLVDEVTRNKSQQSVKASMAYFVETNKPTGLAIFDGRGRSFGGGGFSVWDAGTSMVLSEYDFFYLESAEFYLKEVLKLGIDGETLSKKNAHRFLQSKIEELFNAMQKAYDLDKSLRK